MRFRNWTIADVAKHNMKSGAHMKMVTEEKPADDAVKAGSEKKLHQDIERELLKMRWLYIHSRMDMKTTTQKGVPDFQIYPPSAPAFFIEAKTRVGKMSPEQMAFKFVADLSGHTVHVVRSMREAAEVFNKYKPCDHWHCNQKHHD